MLPAYTDECQKDSEDTFLINQRLPEVQRPPTWSLFRIVLGKNLKAGGSHRQFWLACLIMLLVAPLIGVLQILLEIKADNSDTASSVVHHLRASGILDDAAAVYLITVTFGLGLNLMMDVGTEKDSKILRIQHLSGLPVWINCLAWVSAYLAYGFIVILIGEVCCLMMGCFQTICPVLLFTALFFNYFCILVVCHLPIVIFMSLKTMETMRLFWMGVTPFTIHFSKYLECGLPTEHCIIRAFAYMVPNVGIVSLIRKAIAGNQLGLMDLLTWTDWNYGQDISSWGAPLETVSITWDSLIDNETGVIMMMICLSPVFWGIVVYFVYATLNGQKACSWICFRDRPPGRSPPPGVGISVQDIYANKGEINLLDGISFDCRQGKIFALLGQNGAGKTTLMDVLTGWKQPRAGACYLNGYHLKDNPEAALRSISYCPQVNPVMPSVTVTEHLEFFAKVRGLVEYDYAVDYFLSYLELVNVMDAKVADLSFANKRRLWIATAFLSDAPIVVLDEPTSGMDVNCRKKVWNLFKEMRDRGRCIVFTTHNLEEADILSDRKAIMVDGKIKAIGTSRELRMEFNTGYYLDVRHTGDPDDLRDFVFGTVGCSREISFTMDGNIKQHTFSIPFSDVDELAAVVARFERDRKSLRVRDFAIKMTTLEDVFMKVCENREPGKTFFVQEVKKPSPVIEKSPTFMKQILAVFILRMSIFLRAGSWIIFFLCPAIFQIFMFSFYHGKLAVMDDRDKKQARGSIALGLSLSLMFVVVVITRDIVEDLVSARRKTIHANGVSRLAYWCGMFAYHYMMTLISCLLVATMLFTFMNSVIKAWAMVLVTVECFLFPGGFILGTYVIASALHHFEKALKLINFVWMLICVLPTIAIIGSWWMNTTLGFILHMTFDCFVPTYPLPGLISHVILKKSSQEDDWRRYASSMSVIFCFVGSFIQILVYSALLWLLESRRLRVATPEVDVDQYSEEEYIDKDIIAEENSHIQGAVEFDSIHHSYYSTCKERIPALRGVTIKVPEGECLAMLGPDDCGKTTLLNVLINELNPSVGRAKVLGTDSKSGSSMASVGYCPQENALWPNATGADHLRFYGMVKGISHEMLEEWVFNALDKVGLASHAYSEVREYSGGMQRRLMVACTISAEERICILDEPSIGVDVTVCKHLHSLLNKRRTNQTMIIATNSMKEADACGDRTAIMVKGQLCTIGTSSNLMEKYGHGYRLEMTIPATEEPGRVVKFVKENISQDAQLLEYICDMYVFQLPKLSREFKLSDAFDAIKNARDTLGIREYSLCQQSLEQVYLNFARRQIR